MRDGDEPGRRVRLPPQAAARYVCTTASCDRQQAIADDVLAARQAGRSLAVVVDTREQAAALNSAIRDRLVTAGLVDDRHTASGRAGQPLGAGDQIATRRNDPQFDVANREAWTVTDAHRDGSLTVAGERGPAGAARRLRARARRAGLRHAPRTASKGHRDHLPSAARRAHHRCLWAMSA